jgi:hypothetical protein
LETFAHQVAFGAPEIFDLLMKLRIILPKLSFSLLFGQARLSDVSKVNSFDHDHSKEICNVPVAVFSQAFWF